MNITGLVHSQVTIIESLYPQIVKIKVGSRVNRISKLVELVLTQTLVKTINLNTALQASLESTAMSCRKISDSVRDDIPVEDLLINVGQ